MLSYTNKMKKLSLSLSFFLLILLSACKERGDELDILPLLSEHNFFTQTNKIKADQLHPFYFLWDGWKTAGNVFYMTKPKARIRFFNFSKKSITLTFSAKKGDFFKQLKAISLDVLINGEKITTFSTVAEKKKFTLTLSRKFLREGENFLELLIGKKGQDFFLKNNHRFPHRLLDISKITFFVPETRHFIKTKRGIFQPSESFMLYHIKVPEYAHLKIEARAIIPSPKSAPELYLEILKTGEKRGERIPIEVKNSTIRKKISLGKYAGEIIGLKFKFSSKNRRDLVLWKKISVKGIKKGEQSRKKFSLPNKKTNIFFIIIDAARYKEFVERKDLVKNIINFSEKAFSFKNVYVSAPYTSASVTSYLTGLYPEAHGVRSVREALNHALPTLTDILKKKGYYTLAITGSVVPINIGVTKRFTRTVYIGLRGRINSSKMNESALIKEVKSLKNKTPCFVYIHILPPHEPYNPPHEFQKELDTSNYIQTQVEIKKREYEHNLNPPSQFRQWLYKAYLNNLYYADYVVGKIIEAIKEKSLFDKSIVIITSDHGEAFFEHSKFGHNTTNYREMIHVPFFVKMPGQKDGKNIKLPFLSNIDLIPTIYELLGIESPIPLQGWSFASVVMGKSGNFPERYLYSRATSRNYNFALTGEKYRFYFHLGRDELYSMDDKRESQNLYHSFPVLSGYFRDKAFYILKQNLLYNKKHRFKPERQNRLKRYLQELKSLGYL